MEKLYESDIGAWFQTSYVRLPGTIGASYPFCKLILYNDRLVVRVPLQGEVTLHYNDIDFMEHKFLLGIVIHHRDKTINPFVYFRGVWDGSMLYKRIIEVLKKNNILISTR